MKIDFIDDKDVTSHILLNHGDVFYLPEQKETPVLYMKVEAKDIDVVNLEDGTTAMFGSDTEVIRVNATLKVNMK